jgi:hypothetical protein
MTDSAVMLCTFEQIQELTTSQFLDLHQFARGGYSSKQQTGLQTEKHPLIYAPCTGENW